MKQCNKCKEWKELEDFYTEKSGKYGRRAWCKTCGAKYFKLYRQNNKEKLKFWQIKYFYGVDKKEYNKMLKEHNNVCAICKQPEKRKQKGKRRSLAVDHNHETGKVRGLLCHKCNSGIGLFNESPALLKEASDYLVKKAEEAREKPVRRANFLEGEEICLCIQHIFTYVV